MTSGCAVTPVSEEADQHLLLEAGLRVSEDQKMTPPSRCRLVLTVAAVLASTCVLITRSRFSGSPLHKNAKLAPLGLDATKWTQFGEAPLKFTMSGISCPGSHKHDRLMNGVYHYQGLTADGRPFYRNKDTWLYYDKECNGGTNTQWGEFNIDNAKPSVTARRDLDSDGKCVDYAYTNYGSRGPTLRTRPWMHGKAQALPGATAKWRIYCGGKIGWTVQTVTLKGLPVPQEDLKIRGNWRYVTTVNAGETRKETYGFDTKRSSGGSWDLGGEISATASAKVSAGISFLAEGSVDTGVSATARASMQRSWSSAVSTGTKLTRTIPFKTGGALWQWKFDASKGGDLVDVPADDFALTSNLAEAPKCYPGLSIDGWNYQACVPGGAL
jgi:hypothetical protein